MRNGGNTDITEAQEVLGKSILPMFGLDNESATYPFVDLWGLPHGSLARAQELAKALPSDTQSLSFFRYYRDMAFVIYPGLAQLELFEEELNQFLVVRAANDAAGEGVTEQQVHGQDFHWLGLLFAVLASGAQSSQMQRKERELTSQVYGKFNAIPRRGKPANLSSLLRDGVLEDRQLPLTSETRNRADFVDHTKCSDQQYERRHCLGNAWSHNQACSRSWNPPTLPTKYSARHGLPTFEALVGRCLAGQPPLDDIRSRLFADYCEEDDYAHANALRSHFGVSQDHVPSRADRPRDCARP
jgi:hypothetical protein